MRKSFKKGMAMLLAAAMVFSTPVALDQAVAKAAGTELPAATYEYDFEGDQALQSKGSVKGAESAITLVKDKGTVEVVKDGTNNVLKVSDGGTECFGKNYAKLPAKLFNGVTADSGLTLSMKVKMAKDKNSEWSTIFCSTPTAYNEWNLFKVNANLVTDINAGDPQAWGGTGNDNSFKGHHDGKWHTVTVTVTKQKITTYLDGIEKVSGAAKADSPAGGSGKGFEGSLATIATNAFNVLGCGGFPGEGKAGDKDISEILYDDIKVFTTAFDVPQVYKLATGDDVTGIVPVAVTGGAVTLKEGKLEFEFVAEEGSDVTKGMPISVNGKTAVATGSALTVAEDGKTVKYVYTPEQDGTYKFAVSQVLTEDKVLYKVSGKAEAEISVVKVKDKLYEKDDKLISKELTIAEKGDIFNISWGVVDGAVAEAVVTGPDKKVVKTLTKPEDVKVTAAGNYTVELTVTKDGKAAKDESGFSYNPKSTVAQDKFSKVKPADIVFKSTFDSTDSAKKDGVDMTGSKAKIANGIITFAPSAGYTAKKDAAGRKGDGNQYFAKLPSFSTKDFSKGMTFVMDINVKAEGEWTSLLTLGNGKLSNALANGGVGYHYTLGLSSILDYNDQNATVKTGKIGYLGGGQYVNDKKNGQVAGACPPKAPYTYEWFTKAANRNKWYTLAVTVAENGTMTTYINGEAIQTYKDDSYKEILAAMKKATNNYLGIGYWSHLGDSDYAGSMDDVAIYKTALSAADVKALNRTGTTIGGGGTGGTGTGGTGGGSTAKVSKVSITVPNRKAGKTVYMKKGDKVTLKATVKGSGSYSKSVTWKSSKKSVATVSSKGKVTAKKAGTAKITATSKTDKSKKATITIKVSKKAVKNKVLKISPTKKTLKKGKSLTIKIKKITKKTTDKITYKSSKKSVATVDAYGKVKAKKKGKATITVKCGKKSAKLKLTVKK